MVGADADRRTKVLLPDILFSNTGVPMVADFGQARALDPNGIVTKLPPIYNYGIPPEIFTQKSATFESDIYQVGLTLYRAVNGDSVFQSQVPSVRYTEDMEELQQRVLTGKLPDRDLFLPHVPAKLKSAIKKALNVNSSKRFPSAIGFSDALGRISIACDWKTSIDYRTGEMQWQACRANN